MIQPKLHIDLKWLNRLSINFELFRKLKPDVYNCRCYVCGDSKKNKRVCRMYFYVKGGRLLVCCHNCGYPNDNSASFYKFVQTQFPVQFEDYKKELLLENFQRSNDNTKKQEPVQEKVIIKSNLLHITDLKKLCPQMDKLHDDNKAKQYMMNRRFTNNELKRLFYTSDFKSIVSRINPDASERLPDNEERVLIPFINSDGYVEMVQGRAIKDGGLKYISIKANDEITKIYGQYELDRSKTVYCVEGPIDSIFVDNCIATCDANLTRADADVYIWDNQPRNKDIIKYMESAINSGKSLVIWPTSPNQKQDINDIIKSGFTKEQLMNLIKKNTYSGLNAKLKFTQWRKI